MDPVQLYETRVFDRSSARAMGAVVVPARAIDDAPLEIEPMIKRLGFDRLTVVWLSGADDARNVVGAMLLGHPAGHGRDERDEFLDYVLDGPLLPFESSPLKATSVASLVGAGGSVAVTYTTGHPLLFIVAAGGIVVVGAAQGLADALNIGLRARLLDLMGVEDPESPTVRRRRRPSTGGYPDPRARPTD